jgi:hypothetical protein
VKRRVPPIEPRAELLRERSFHVASSLCLREWLFPVLNDWEIRNLCYTIWLHVAIRDRYPSDILDLFLLFLLIYEGHETKQHSKDVLLG